MLLLLPLTVFGCSGGSGDSDQRQLEFLSAASITGSSLRPPTPVLAEDEVQLVYELVIRNQSEQRVTVSRLEVFDDDLPPDIPLVVYEGEALRSRMFANTQRIDADAVSLVFLWLTVDPAALPSTLLHRVTLLSDGSRVQIEELRVEVATDTPVPLGPPVRGERWVSANISNTSHHRRAVFVLNNVPRIPQRFAIDWAQVGADGTSFVGDPLLNSSYRAYGAELLAVADGVVVAMQDGSPESVPGSPQPTTPANFVLVDIGNDQFAYYAHLIPGSLQVQVGDVVFKGDVLGLVGNSGNSTAPHLHFAVIEVFDLDNPSFLDAAGLPFVFESFVIQENRPVLGERRFEIPLDEAVVRFPSVP